ncbi:hypothetical protein DAPPUDRAFT_238277 [Daphnia pulex]|uniref:Uncharacterized protein n=1 Tax=Daphnia pulex TaxID=6669 RepID=E9G604_DAPPU|nr:hypothetical protein DAPPUDRAFT_238277 [Daphnia pulex]|eukprot:EFX85079.1 hypothetical protein DAPPUDRAFT_238277 [Daphnia pulex]
MSNKDFYNHNVGSYVFILGGWLASASTCQSSRRAITKSVRDYGKCEEQK